jgi:hypothetical protein
MGGRVVKALVGLVLVVVVGAGYVIWSQQGLVAGAPPEPQNTPVPVRPTLPPPRATPTYGLLPTSTPEKRPTVIPADLSPAAPERTFTNQIGKYRLRYPADWYVQSSDVDTSLLNFDPANPAAGPPTLARIRIDITTVIPEKRPGETVEQWVERGVTIRATDKVVSKTSVRVGSAPEVKLVVESTAEGPLPVTYTTYWVDGGDVVYAIGPRTGAPSLLSNVEQILMSFEFLK